ncbi:MAG: LptE family protein, partial [Bacteroidales bacterium]|nr:LptE family protein [Bacteroidales bacterium]
MKHRKQQISYMILSLVMVLALSLTACKISYKFTGASIPIEAKTISIAYFRNQAPLVNPLLSQTFSEGLRDFFERQVNLDLVERGGDLSFEGEITGYNLTPVSLQSDATSAMTRLTITVNVRFVNRFDAEQDFEKSFSQFLEFDDDVNFASSEATLVDEIN